MFEHVADDELLYRRIRPDGITSALQPSGEYRLSSSAFSDSTGEISVDRARLCGSDPAWTQKGDPRSGVVSLLTQAIRAISDLHTNDPKGNPLITHTVDVKPDPLPDNRAHALIVAVPPITSKSAFRRLQTALAQLAQWEINLTP